MKTSKTLIGTTVITAVAASLCCITPVLALIAGTSGIAASFSWIEPFRPYLIALTILVLALAWYQKLQAKPKEIDCDCEDKTPTFMNSKTFLLLVTLFAGLMLAFPWYSHLVYPNSNKEVVYVSESNSKRVIYNIQGMTCTGCEIHIETEVNKLDGIIEVKANYDKGTTLVIYDKTKLSTKEIEEAIKNTGYKIID
jgi:mercuric ion transport protein